MLLSPTHTFHHHHHHPTQSFHSSVAARAFPVGETPEVTTHHTSNTNEENKTHKTIWASVDDAFTKHLQQHNHQWESV